MIMIYVVTPLVGNTVQIRAGERCVRGNDGRPQGPTPPHPAALAPTIHVLRALHAFGEAHFVGGSVDSRGGGGVGGGGDPCGRPLVSIIARPVLLI